MRLGATVLLLILATTAPLVARLIPTSVLDLPATVGLPDLFSLEDGTPVMTVEQWGRRRVELMWPVLYYQYGRVPPRPQKVTGRVDREIAHKSGLGKEVSLTLLIESPGREKLKMRAVAYVPKTKGPYPVIIEEEGSPGGSKNAAMFMKQNYLFIEYARGDLAPDRRKSVGPAQKAYPEYDWAMLAVWAWGGMRVVDYLETRDDVDLERIAITGHSRGGKAALLAGALDERITLVAPCQSGAGGAGSSRNLGPGAESIGMNDKPNWYHERILMFAKHEERMPFDQHFVKALVAPRALYCMESSDDLFANPQGTYATSKAAMAVYELYGKQHLNGLRFRRGGHSYDESDWKALLDFAEFAFFERAPAGKKFWERPASVEPALGTGGEPGFVRVGDPGNKSDRDYPRVGPFGAVDHSFEIGRHKVSNAEYAKFLTAVAATSDLYGLFHPEMNIRRGGHPGKFVYDAHPATANAAVTYVSWYDALRYCNWLHGGDTESGVYQFSKTGRVRSRLAHAKFFLPTENEWVKGAYYDATFNRYRLFPVRGSAVTRNSTEELRHSLPQGTSRYGMTGLNEPIWEWTESKVGEAFRGIRCGEWFQGNNRQAAGRFYSNPDLELGNIGFRVARAVK